MSARRGLRSWCLLLGGWPAVVAAQVPAGPEFRANTYTTGGCGGGSYCPAASVTREQMGVFLRVTFDLTLYGL